MHAGKAAVVTVGTELVEGLRRDTNGPFICRELIKRGFSVTEVVSVRDDAEEIAAAVGPLIRNNELVISTGGLGPTHDDLTRDGIAMALGVGLHEDADDKARLEALASGRGQGLQVLGDFMRQALVIDGAALIKPLTGTAPAQVVPTPAGKMLVLPGPPGEMEPLLMQYMEGMGQGIEACVDIACFGRSESYVQHLVEPLIADAPELVFTVLASAEGCHVILTDSGCAKGVLAAKAKAVREALGDIAFSDDGKTLAQVVVELAVREGGTLSCAESCTGGLVAGEITSVAGSSAAFLGGVVSYANEVKEGVLGVSPQTLAEKGAVSLECAMQMADGARSLTGATLAVSTTGIAGPGGGTPQKPVGTVCFGLSAGDGDAGAAGDGGGCGGYGGTSAYIRHWRGGSREAVRARAVSFALDLLRRKLMGLPMPPESID